METAVRSSVLMAPAQESLTLGSDLAINEPAMTSVIDHMLGTTLDHTTTALKKPSAAVTASEQAPEAVVKRGRGRPPKKNKPANEPPPTVVKRKRGRPKKHPVPPEAEVDTKASPKETPLVVSSTKVTGNVNQLLVEKIAENLAIATAIKRSGLKNSEETNVDSDSSSAGVAMNLFDTSPIRKQGRPRKRPLELDEEPEPAKRPREEIITFSRASPQLLQAEQATLLFSLPECEVTKARVDIDRVEGPGRIFPASTTSETVVVQVEESPPPVNAPPPSNTVAKRKRGRPPKKDSPVKRGRGRPPKICQQPSSMASADPPPTVVMKELPPDPPLDDATPTLDHTGTSIQSATPPKRKRGRPPKTSVAKQQERDAESAKVNEVGVVKRGRGRPRKPKSPEKVEKSAPVISVDNQPPKRGRGRPRKNRPPSISELAEQILLVKDTSSVDQNGDPLPSVGGVVIKHANEGAAVPQKRKRGRPRKHPIGSPKPPAVAGKKRGRPKINRDDKSPPSSVMNSDLGAVLVSPMLGGVDLSPPKKLMDFSEDRPMSGGVESEGFKLHMSFSDSDSDGSDGMGVQDTDIQALAERVTRVATPPSMHPVNTSDERDSPLLGSRFEESFDEDSDAETNK